MGQHLKKSCSVCFKTMRSDTIKRHMLTHEKGRKNELKAEKIKIREHLANTCEVCNENMRGDNLKRYMLKHEKWRKDDVKKVDEKAGEVISKETRVKQQFQMLMRSLQLETAESIKKNYFKW